MVNGGPRYLFKLEMLRRELDSTLDQIESLWQQKSRVDWIRDGDHNTTYYHTSTAIRRRFNRIKTLKGPDDSWQSDPAQVKELVVSHFKFMFVEPSSNSQSRGSLLIVSGSLNRIATVA